MGNVTFDENSFLILTKKIQNHKQLNLFEAIDQDEKGYITE